MKTCTLCGHAMADGESECSRCGFRITEAGNYEQVKSLEEPVNRKKVFDLENEKGKAAKKMEELVPSEFHKYAPAMKFFFGLLFAPAFLIFFVHNNEGLRKQFKYIIIATIVLIYILMLLF